MAGGAYQPGCDVNQNCVIDILDVQLTAGHWNQSGVFTSGGWELTGNLIVVLGLARVKVAQGEALTPGQRLKASDAAGEARGLRTVEVDGVTLDEGGPTVGVALDAANDGLVWVMVALQ